MDMETKTFEQAKVKLLEKNCMNCKNKYKCRIFIPIEKNEGGCDSFKLETKVREE